MEDHPEPAPPEPTAPPTDSAPSEPSAPPPPPARPPSPPPPPAARAPLREIEVRSRPLVVAGVEWIVNEGGRAASGRAGDPRAALTLLVFVRASEPGTPVSEILAPIFGLDDASDDELAALLARARPFRGLSGRSEVFPDTRRKGAKGM